MKRLVEAVNAIKSTQSRKHKETLLHYNIIKAQIKG